MNTGYSYLSATENDLPVLIKLAREVIQYNYSLFLDNALIQNFMQSGQCDKEILKNMKNCIIMKRKTEYIGFSILLENKIHLMMFAPAYQNQGHGTTFLSYLENRLFLEYKQIELQSFIGNTIANKFYEKNGWIKTETIKTDIEIYLFTKNRV